MEIKTQLPFNFDIEISYDQERVLNVINGHFSNEPITAAAICLALSMSDSSLRDRVRELRRKGFKIGSGSKGYYLFRTEEELEQTTGHMRKRALSLLKTASVLRNQTIYELIGQEELR